MPQFSAPELSELYATFTSESRLTVPQRSDGLALLVLNVSEGCNLACTYCFADRGRYGAGHSKWMSLETATAALDFVEANYAHLGAIKFFGGEPFIRFEMMRDFVEELRRRAFFSHSPPELIAITNLTRLTDEMIAWVKEARVRLTISYDGTPELNDRHRVYPSGKGSAQLILRNMDRLGSAMRDAVIEVVYGPAHVASGLSMSDVVELLHDRFAPRAVLIHPMLRTKFGALHYSDAEWAAYDRVIRDHARDHARGALLRAYADDDIEGLGHHVDALFKREKADRHCGLGVDTVTVRASGGISPCYTLSADRSFDMGDVRDGRIGEDYIAVSDRFIDNRKSQNPVCAG